MGGYLPKILFFFQKVFSQWIDGKSQKVSNTSEPRFSCDKCLKICWVNMPPMRNRVKGIAKLSYSWLVQPNLDLL